MKKEFSSGLFVPEFIWFVFCFITVLLYLGCSGTNEQFDDLPPIADFELDSNYSNDGLVPLTVQFRDLSENSIYSWEWDFGEGDTSQSRFDQNPVHTYIYPDTYTVMLKVSGPGGSDTEVKPDYIKCKLGILDAGFSANSTSGTAPKTIHFTNTTTGTYQRCQWTFGDGGTSTICNPDHTYNSPDCHTVSLTVFDDDNDRFETETKSSYICLEPLCDTDTRDFGTQGPFCAYRCPSCGTAFENYRPRIKCEVWLQLYNNNTKIRGKFYIWAMEDQPGDSDWGDSLYYVYNLGNYTAPSGFHIESVSPNYASYNKVDTEKAWDYQGTALGTFEVLGQTENEDLSYDGLECLAKYDRTKFYFDFNNVTIKICKNY